MNDSDSVQDFNLSASGEMPAMEAAPPPEPLSVIDKFTGIFSDPKSVFQNVREAGPRVTDWLLPLLLAVVALATVTLVRFADPAFTDMIRQQQTDAMQKQVDEGKMTQEQADQAVEQMNSMGPGFMKIMGVLGVAIGMPLMFFLMVLIFWLILRYLFKGTPTIAMVLSVMGLVSYFTVLDQILSVILSFVTGNPFAGATPAIFMQPDLQSTTYKALAAINPIYLWAMYVQGVGFHKVGEISLTKTLGLVYGLWIAWTLLSVFVFGGFGMGM